MEKKNNYSVAILLSAYNGEKYISEQIDSILNQSYKYFSLYIRDDSSSDRTKDIIRSYANKDNRIVIIDDDMNRGASGSFFYLIRNVDADVYFFSDQDDVWLDNKIELCLQEINKHGIHQPLLVNTDLKVVDAHLKEISHSFYEYINIDLDVAKKKKQILFQNYVVGCTVCLTRPLVDIALPKIEDEHFIAMHDWWFALVATYFGQIITVKKSTMLYRQHGGNVLGAQNNSLTRYFYSLVSFKGFKRVKNFRRKVFLQDKLFERYFYKNLGNDDRKIIYDTHLISESAGLLSVYNFIYRKGFTLQSFKRNIAFLFSSYY
ncbi:MULTISPECIES: glycosyltransferase family 2 protein [unclassified Brenneria]|uniref:glycosyltransferase family 2 protein n=1 Tax=unclassified Brenneria TaxID=2634434 RepID=UPI00155559B9|nr:glycosyltransferase family 2 protein [Brenneria sp. hezel4-2-4]MEE3650979.1 glycosyltransferase family 2 protein [Brenneria sp. HEZEL_4_2_4]NPD00934.1 glycosyltransferase family 2 protein [Brenneria sp. hezel4-2-4]